MEDVKIESYSEEQVPVFWKGNNQDVEDIVKEVKKGKVHKLRDSAGGRPIYMIEYGSSNMPPSQATLSSALGVNDEGVNLMHDDFFGNASPETRNILDICREQAPDVSVLFHGGTGCVNHLMVPTYVSDHVKERTCELIGRSIQAYEKAGLRFGDDREALMSSQGEPVQPFNLISAMHHCCGEMCITFESNQGLVDKYVVRLDNEQIYLSHMLFIRCIFEMLTEEVN